MKKLLLLFTLVSILSCGVQPKATIPESFIINIPDLNNINKTEIGITLVTKESGYKYPAIRILKTQKVKPGFSVREIKEGDIYIQNLFTKQYNLYSNVSDSSFGVATPVFGGKTIPYFNNGSGVNFIHIKDTIEFEKTFVLVPKKEYFKQEFIYNGRIGNAIKFVYREYNEDIARPAFTQDLQYDLTDSNTIGFRGLRIDVISATNTIIEYKVLNQFIK